MFKESSLCVTCQCQSTRPTPLCVGRGFSMAGTKPMRCYRSCPACWMHQDCTIITSLCLRLVSSPLCGYRLGSALLAVHIVAHIHLNDRTGAVSLVLQCSSPVVLCLCLRLLLPCPQKASSGKSTCPWLPFTVLNTRCSQGCTRTKFSCMTEAGDLSANFHIDHTVAHQQAASSIGVGAAGWLSWDDRSGASAAHASARQLGASSGRSKTCILLAVLILSAPHLLALQLCMQAHPEDLRACNAVACL